LKAARKLNYRPNAMARALRQAQTMSLGLFVPDVSNFVYFELIRGVEQRAFEAGYALLLANAHESDKVEEVYKRLVHERRVDGLLVASASDEDTMPFDVEDETSPIIWVNRRRKSRPSVVEDDESGMAMAVEHLVSLGHKDIAHIAGPQEVDTARRRLNGFAQAMAAAGLQVRPEYVVSCPFTEQGGADCMRRLLEVEPLPTAIAASSLSATIGALSVAKQAGLHIPDDLSFAAFHDATIAAYMDPPLTTVRMPLHELGELAVDRLLHLMGGGELPAETLVSTPPQLIQRQSTAPPTR
jgi:LacI family transcriptional regulator